jgi:hypothetical protein
MTIPGFINILLKFYRTGIAGWLILAFLQTILLSAAAQTSARSELPAIMSSIKNRTASMPVEKLYLQLDKPWYAAGDTLWFKAYLFDATYLSASSLGGILYIELANDSNRTIKRLMLPVSLGLSWGHITLDEKDIPQGGYTLRAYTNWMRNFNDNYIFKKHIFIGNTAAQQWSVSLHTELFKVDGKEKANLTVGFNNLGVISSSPEKLQLKIMDGSSVLYQQAVEAGNNKYNADFFIPERMRSGNLALVLQEVQKGAVNLKKLIPVFLNRPQNTDLQFMPESGYLLNDISTRLAFKATAEDGRGTDISGIIYNNKEEKVTAFKSLHNGMGSFNLKPLKDESYHATVSLPDGILITYPLPVGKETGTSLSIINLKNSDSLEITISCTPDIADSGQNYYIIGQARGVVCLAGSIAINKTSTKTHR